MVHNNVTLPSGSGDDGGTTPVLYEELAEIEQQFEDVDVWLSKALYGFFLFLEFEFFSRLCVCIHLRARQK